MGLQRVQRGLLALVFVGIGTHHLVQPRFYEAIMPPILPAHRLLVLVSGIAEIGLGLLALLPCADRWTRRGLVALLLAVFPANINMALHPAQFAAIPAWLLWARLPLQPALMVWIWRTLAPRPPR